jgi:hypothetical protein
VSVPSGDPQAMRSLATRLRMEAGEIESIFARTAHATELPRNQGEAADRDREAARAFREAGARIARRFEALASDIDAGAAWLDQAILDARARGELV